MSIHWNDQQEHLAIQWAERAICYTWLHNEASNDYNRKRRYIGIPTIIVSSLASAGNISTINSNPRLGVQIANGVTSFATVLLATLNNFLKYGELAEAHRNMSKEFAIYSRAIATQLSFPNSDRDDPKEYLLKYQQLFDDLIAKAPHIPDHIITRFTKTKIYEDESFAKPLIVNALEPIIAHESTSNRQIISSSSSLHTPSAISVFKRTATKVKTIGDISRKLSQDLTELEGTMMDTLAVPVSVEDIAPDVPITLDSYSSSDSSSERGTDDN